MTFTNSKLLSYTKISPNKTSPRNHLIDTVTVHCVAGQCSVETLGNIFSPVGAGASSNYGIGNDGRFGMYVEEKDRSWCSSNAANDNRAVTIEVASDTNEPYAVNAKAYAALLDLVTDICMRNGIKKLIWSTDKNERINHLNGCNMTVHRDYANKACPGTYLYERHGEIAAEVNKRLGTAKSTAPTLSQNVNISSEVSTGSEADMQIFHDFFMSKLGNEFGVAGLWGNIYAESGGRSNNLQSGYEIKFGCTDETYTEAVDKGYYNNFANDSAGYGLAQWTYYTRKRALLDYAKGITKSIGDYGMQLEFLYRELVENYPVVLKTLKTARSIKEASDVVLTKFERPDDISEKVKNKRVGYGQTFYDKFCGKSIAKVPYLVKIVADALNIRKGAGDNFPVVGCIKDHGVYTIVEESGGYGKLKSGAGWIMLGYTKKV